MSCDSAAAHYLCCSLLEAAQRFEEEEEQVWAQPTLTEARLIQQQALEDKRDAEKNPKTMEVKISMSLTLLEDSGVSRVEERREEKITTKPSISSSVRNSQT